MTKPYFRQVPNFDYVSRNPGDKYISEYIPVKNLFKRGKLREDIFANLQFFEKYQIIGDERPDNVAFKFYGDSTLDWVVLLSNNILNIQSEWPMTQDTFDKVMLEKYGSYEDLYSGIHHYETNEIKNSLGVRVLQGGLNIQPTWKTNGNFIEIINSKIANISATQNADGETVGTNSVSVYMINSIPDLEVGDQITISNVSESQYNGKHIITEILAQDQNNVTAFKYELPFVPNVDSPTLADPRQEEVLFTITETSQITANSYYYEYWDDGLGYTVQVPSTSVVRAVTNYEYESKIEEDKRNIFVLKPRYLNVVFNDMDDIMPYKRGSIQYISDNLKRGDNIRLYE
jgi:hypothetical protein